MTEFQEIPIHSDIRLAVILADETGLLTTPAGRHTRLRCTVSGRCFEAECDDSGQNYVNCEIETVRIPVIESGGGLRIPSSPDEGTPTDIQAIVVNIPAYTFPIPGIMYIASCNVNIDKAFPDNRYDHWLAAKPTTFKYVAR